MSGDILQITARILPILLLIGLGNVFRWKSILSPAAMGDLKTLVVNVALPAVFFLSFLELELNPSYLVLVALIIGICAVQFGYGKAVRRVLGIREAYFPFLTTAFELGMVGITLFGAAFGLDAVGYIGVFGIGHEFFVWFIMVTLLISLRDGVSRIGENVKRFATSPVIIAIFAGIACNLLGIAAFLQRFVISEAVLTSLDYLSKLTIPLILVIVGYGMKFDLHELKRPLAVITARLVLLVPLALLLNRFLIRGLLGMDPLFEHALFTVMILPPPFIIPLYIRQDDLAHLRYANNTLTMHTVFTICIFVVYLVLTVQPS
jgi:hypothetical protein